MLTPFRRDKTIDFPVLEQLIEFYLENGASGLFANCLSSEMYELDEKERLAIIGHVVKRVHGRVPIAATGTFGGPLKEQIKFIEKVSGLGAEVIVLISSQLCGENQDESVLRNNIIGITGAIDHNSLGLYECPLPYKRILSKKLVNELALSGRFTYLKDTTCNTEMVKQKIEAAAGTSLAVFNANTPTSLDTLRAGADGISPISANFYPELYSWLVKYNVENNNSDRLENMNDMLILMDAVTRINYPMNAKVFLAKRGIKIEPVIRTSGHAMNYEENKILDKLYQQYLQIVANI